MPAIINSRVPATVAVLLVALACAALLVIGPLDADASSAAALTVGGALDAPPVPAGFVGISLEYPAVAAYAGNPASLEVLASLIRNLDPRSGAGAPDRWLIGRLRRKIEDDPSKPRRIVTVHGVGYVFAG